jgi:hypothetical protein
MTPGMLLPTGLLRMSVELDGELSNPSCQREIAKTLQNTLRQCGLFQEDDIYTMLGGNSKPSIIVFYCEQKKTPEKNGVM